MEAISDALFQYHANEPKKREKKKQSHIAPESPKAVPLQMIQNNPKTPVLIGVTPPVIRHSGPTIQHVKSCVASLTYSFRMIRLIELGYPMFHQIAHNVQMHEFCDWSVKVKHLLSYN